MPSDLRFSELYSARPHSSEDEDFHRHHPGCPHVFTCRVCGEETEATLSLLERAGRRPGFAHTDDCPVGLLEATGDVGLGRLYRLREENARKAARAEHLRDFIAKAADLRPAAFLRYLLPRADAVKDAPEPSTRVARTFRVAEHETPAGDVCAVLRCLVSDLSIACMDVPGTREGWTVWTADLPEDVTHVLAAIPGVDVLPPGGNVQAWP